MVFEIPLNIDISDKYYYTHTHTMLLSEKAFLGNISELKLFYLILLQ